MGDEKMVRKPVVAGQFYPGSSLALKDEIAKHISKETKKEKALGLVMPHAGYPYSGPVAGQVISRVEITDTVIILGPNHTGRGEPYSLMSEGTWETPLGNVEIDTELANAILKNTSYLKDDTLAHAYEHSIEVQLPFLQYFKSDFKFVPISLSSYEGKTLKSIGQGLAQAIKDSNRDVMIIASSDMTHYESHEQAKMKDAAAIEAILKLDEDGLLRKVDELNISMCGWMPTVVMLSCCKQLGAKTARLVKYQTSGETTGDYTSVVGYAGIIICG